MKPKISVWAAKTWKTAGKCEGAYRTGRSYCVIGAAMKSRYGDRYAPSYYSLYRKWSGSQQKIEQLIKFNDRPETTKAQVLAYARRLGL